MPLADRRGVVALRAQERSDGGAARFDEIAAAAVEHAGLQARPPAVAPGEDAVTRGRADGRRRMHVSEADAFGGQACGVRRQGAGVAVVALEIAPAEVVAEDADDVRALGGRGGRSGERSGQRGQELAAKQSVVS